METDKDPSCQGCREGGRDAKGSTGDFPGRGTPLSETLMVNAWHHAFVKTHEMCTTPKVRPILAQHCNKCATPKTLIIGGPVVGRAGGGCGWKEAYRNSILSAQSFC